MSFELRLSHPGHPEEVRNLPVERFAIGAGVGDWPVSLALEGLVGVLVEVRRGSGGPELRAEPGAPVEGPAGPIGSRFEPLLQGAPLRIADWTLELRWLDEEPRMTGVDLEDWFETVMGLADRLEGVGDLEELVDQAMGGLLEATPADRAFLRVESEAGAREWFRTRVGGREPFGVSRSLIDRVRHEKGFVFVPESAQDPAVSAISSVRREGIHSSLVVPLHALGRSLGMLYADCVATERNLGPSDFQIAALLGRMLAGALGSRDLLRSVLEAAPDLPRGLQSRSPACQDMIEKARVFAPTGYTVLVRGETGSGKEVLARALHTISRRARGPFVAVNCAAIPAQLMESELFGHVKGSFTGATADREGFFVAADQGTLFLDEIGDMELELQAKILRVLETREVTPVGGTRSRPVDVRIIAATHQDLERMVAESQFREDLYYRLRELEIRIPPLRERPEDILDLAEEFLVEAARELPFEGHARLHPEAVRALLEHDWRGNIRELRHTMRTATLRASGGEVRAEHLELRRGGATPERPEPEAGNWKERLEAQEREALEQTLRKADGNLTKAAMLFGLPRTTYRERLIRHGLLEK
ncbi:MAG: sigma-54-dependent Fis family transcriptional regulator [Planctomycetota bacterium]